MIETKDCNLKTKDCKSETKDCKLETKDCSIDMFGVLPTCNNLVWCKRRLD